MLKCEALSVRFGGLLALDGVSLLFPPGEITAVIGANGAGKTTLVNVLTGFCTAHRGRIHVGDIDVTGWPPFRFARSGIVRTWQQVRVARQATVLDNVVFGCANSAGARLLQTFSQASRNLDARHKQRARQLLDTMGITEKASHLAGELSYGQQKVVALLSAVLRDPVVLILDEPFAGLAPEMSQLVERQLLQLRDTGTSLVWIEHDLDAIGRLANRVVVLQLGRVVADGLPVNILNDPMLLDAYV